MKKKILYTLLAALLLIILWLAMPHNAYLRKALIYQLPGIEDYQHFDNRAVQANAPLPWPMDTAYNWQTIPQAYQPQFDHYQTVAYLVLRHGQLVHEQYWDGYGPTSYSNSFSMSKSIVGLLVGCAIAEGKIDSLDQPVQHYLPWLTSYNGTTLTLRHLLTMTAGIGWDEEYSSAFSLTTKAYYGNDLDALMRSIQLVDTPGSKFYYQSGVTQLLAMVLTQATGQTLSDYASEKLWTPLGAEHPALWMLDHKGGMEKAYCCFNSNARDFARLGQLVLNQGNWHGRQLVPAWYIQASTTPAPNLIDHKTGQPVNHYGYQWWIVHHKGHQIPYMRGILGQYVFVIPDKDMVVVRLGHKRAEERNEQGLPLDIPVWLDAALEMY